MSKSSRKYRKRHRSSSSESSSSSSSKSSIKSDSCPPDKKSKLSTPNESPAKQIFSKSENDKNVKDDLSLDEQRKDAEDREKSAGVRSKERRSSKERTHEKKRSRDRSRTRKRSRSRERRRSRSRRRSRERSRERRRSRERSRERRRSRDKSRERRRQRDKSRERRRSRERSPERRRSRERSRERKRSRERSRERKRSRDRRRSRERSPDRAKDTKDKTSESSVIKSASPADEPVTASTSLTDKTNEQLVEILTSANKQDQIKKMEDIFKKRREQAEKWRREKKNKESESIETTLKNIVIPTKKWTLEDDEDDEEPPPDGIKSENNNDPDEIDPLDAFMQDLQKESSKLTASEGKEEKKKVHIVKTVAKQEKTKFKGELMEQNQDALEYSSEEEEDQEANTNQNGKSKKLVSITADDLNYMPFQKNLYVEVPELSKMTTEEVEAYREELESIKIKGKDCPKPIKIWAQCGLNKKILELLKSLSYDKPTPIQAQAIPAIMSGRDVIGIAKTGSGKTLAFLLPMFRHIKVQPLLEDGDGAIGIIVTPTRELAMQIAKECKKFAKPLKLTVACVYGGTGVGDQIAQLKRGVEIIVCTPGRMIEMLAGGGGKITNLRRCTYLVLDEADRMFDMGFEPQLMRIIDSIRPDRQTVMFSATFPRMMEALARRILYKPIEITVGGRSVVCKDIKQEVMVVEEDDKFLKLLEILGMYYDKGSAIVFVDKQEKADYLLTDLMKASYNSMTLHGAIDQVDRESTIADFKAGKVNVLVATSIAARGLDVKHLILVVNYDCPNHYEDYVHRCGRTGRAGKTGYAYTFLTPEQGKNAGDIMKALELSESPVPDNVKNLWEKYKAEQEALGKKVKSNSGFSGKGFKFDEAEAQLMKEKKKMQKASLDINDSDDEEEDATNLDEEIENIFSSKKTVVKAPLANNLRMAPASTSDKLKLAMERASSIVLKKDPEPHKDSGPSILTDKAKELAQERARRLCIQMNYVPKESDEEAEEQAKLEEPQTYEEELEINDFPQNVRWKITYREKLAQIGEYADVIITSRGTYIPPGKEPGEGERKLYLLLEGRTELALSKAKSEIVRVIKEEIARSSQALPSKGRYTVL